MVNSIYEGFGRWRSVVSTEQHERLLQELKALQELLAVQDRDLVDMQQLVGLLEDQSAAMRVELEQCKLSLEGHGKANAQLKEDLRLEEEASKAPQELLAIQAVTIAKLEMRKEIIDFAEGMQRQLDAHASQHGDAWKRMHPLDILVYLIGDLGKLAYSIRCVLYKGGALRPDPEQDWSLFADQILEYAHDVGNLAMMIADRIRILCGKADLP